MLFRPAPKAAADEMPQTEFISGLRRHEVGREVISSRDDEIRDRRRAAADTLIVAPAEAADALRDVDAAIAREAAAIMSLADQLEAAQTRHGELTLQKAETETRRDRALQSARAELFATVPSEFIALEAHAKAAEHSAKFQMSLRIPAVTSGLFGEPAEVSQKTHDDALANHAENRKLMARAIEVRREITAMILKAELGPTDLEHVERLRRYLNMPEQLY